MSGETEREVSGWTVDTLHAMFEKRFADVGSNYTTQLADLRVMLDERYNTSVKALDAAFVAQQTAMRVALESAEKAVATALLSAKEAVAKAELSADKRFESVNEFRAQLSDQANTFLPRAEAEVRITSLAERQISDARRMTDRLDSIDKRLSARLDIDQGHNEGDSARMDIQRMDRSLIVAIMGAVFVGISVVITVIVAFHK